MVFKAKPDNMQWTDDADLDQTEVPNSDPVITYQWIGNVLVHEFGHTFGLADRYERRPYYDRDYDGIMKTLQKGDDSILPDDKAALKTIYKTHVKGEGW